MRTRSLRLLSLAALIASSFACDQAQKAAGTIAESTPAAAPTEPPKPAGLTIHYVPPDIGMKVKTTSTSHFDIDAKIVTAKGTQVLKLSDDDATTRTTLVTATNDGLITGARVTYESASTVKNENGSEKKELSPVTGREYEVAWQGDDVKVTDTTGRKASAEEIETVRGSAQGLQKYGLFVKALPTDAIMPGQALTVPDTVWKDVTAFELTETQIGNATTKLDEIQQKDGRTLGVFSTSFSMAGVTKTDAGISSNITGQIVVDAATGAIVSAIFSGPVTITGTKPGQKLTGLGKFESHVEATVER